MPGAYGYADPLFLLLAALALEAYLGGLGWFARLLARPRALAVGLARALQRRLDRPQRGEAERRRRGWVVALALLALAGAAGWLLALITRFYPFAWALELVLLVALLQQRRTLRDASRLTAALARGDSQRARSALLRLSAGDLDPLALERLGPDALAAAAAEALGRRLVDRLVSPLFWYVVLGPGGLAVQQAAQLLARLYGGVAAGASGGAEPAAIPPFARGAIRLAWLLDWLPARLARLLLAAAARTSPPEGREAGAGAVPALRRRLDLFARACLLQAVALVLLLSARLLLLG